MLAWLGIDSATIVAHSNGARMAVRLAQQYPGLVNQMVLINPACTGDSWHAYRRLLRSNLHEVGAGLTGKSSLGTLVVGGAASTLFALRNPYRVLHEKRIIQADSLWPVLDSIESQKIPTNIIAARGDDLVDYAATEAGAQERPWIGFTPTEGRHSNIRTEFVQQLALEALIANRDRQPQTLVS
jgi:pimeloyl-ACP methyl ester carboxylesterase